MPTLAQVVAAITPLFEPAPQPEPTPVPTTTLPMRDIGLIRMDGSRLVSTGFMPNMLVVAKLVVPDAVGLTYISIFEYGSGATSRKAWVSKVRGDLSGDVFGGSSPHINLAIGRVEARHVSMTPGETWYVHVKNERADGTPSTTGENNVGIKCYPPR